MRRCIGPLVLAVFCATSANAQFPSPFRVTVVDAARHPLPGALVHVIGGGFDDFLLAGADGIAEFGDRSHQTWSLDVNVAGYAPFLDTASQRRYVMLQPLPAPRPPSSYFIVTTITKAPPGVKDDALGAEALFRGLAEKAGLKPAASAADPDVVLAWRRSSSPSPNRMGSR